MLTASSSQGQLSVSIIRLDQPFAPGFRWQWGHYLPSPPWAISASLDWRVFGTGFLTSEHFHLEGPRTTMRPLRPGIQLFIPHWVACLFALAPLGTQLWLRRQARLLEERRRCGCVHCGYDLRATPRRCPECGTLAHES